MLPTLVLENQFGEVSKNFVIGGSSQISAKFTVTPTNADGITNLVANGIDEIFMHTSTTPSAGNPNPASGYIVAKFSKGFSSFVGLQSTIIPPQSGASLLVASAGLSLGAVYVITILGTTSQAQWEQLGVPAGITAVLGLAFVATATSATGTGAVQIPVVGGAAIVAIQPLGNPSVGSLDDGSAGFVTLACYGAGGSVPAHTHDLLVKGGQAAATTNMLANYATSILGKQEATDATFAGVDSATKGGVRANTASAAPVTTPVDGTVIELLFSVVPLPEPMV